MRSAVIVKWTEDMKTYFYSVFDIVHVMYANCSKLVSTLPRLLVFLSETELNTIASFVPCAYFFCWMFSSFINHYFLRSKAAQGSTYEDIYKNALRWITAIRGAVLKQDISYQSQFGFI